MAKAKKLPSGNWRVQAYATVNGKVIKKSFTAETQKQANYLAENWQEHIRMIGNDSTTMTLEEAVNQYISNKSNVLSASTLLAYKRYLETGFEDLKQLKLYQINSVSVQKSINKYSAKLSPKSLKNYYGLIFATLRLYYPELVLQVTFPKKPKQIKRQFSKDYIVSILKCVENSSIELPVLLAITLSLRASEIAGLKWEDIDFANRTINIHRVRVNSENGFVYKDIPKTDNSNRIAYINDLLLKKLKTAKSNSKSEYITEIKPSQYWRMLKRKTDSAGIEQLRFHDLRHINASIMLSLGINNQISQEIGGWATDNIMKSVYQHTFSEERIEANEKLNKYFSSLSQNNKCEKCKQPLKTFYTLNQKKICEECYKNLTRDDIINLFEIKVKQPRKQPRIS